jgi:hypothetical protein
MRQATSDQCPWAKHKRNVEFVDIDTIIEPAPINIRGVRNIVRRGLCAEKNVFDGLCKDRTSE